MSKLLTNRLWNVCFGKNKNIRVSQIEAATAAEAEAVAMKNIKERPVMLDSEPIYESSIGVELTGGDAESANGIFEINIKGTDQSKVDEFMKYLACLINGMPIEYEFPNEANKRQDVHAFKLKRFISENEMTVVSL